MLRTPSSFQTLRAEHKDLVRQLFHISDDSILEATLDGEYIVVDHDGGSRMITDAQIEDRMAELWGPESVGRL